MGVALSREVKTVAFGRAEPATRAPRVSGAPHTGQRKSSTVSLPFACFSGRRRGAAGARKARRGRVPGAPRPAVYPRCLFFVRLHILFKAGIFLCRGPTCDKLDAVVHLGKSAAPLLQTLRSFSARGACSAFSSPRPFLPRGAPFAGFSFWGCWGCACGALFFFACGAWLAAAGALPAALMAAAAAPTAALCTFGRGRAVLLRALWRIRLSFHPKVPPLFSGRAAARTGLFPRRGLLLRLYGRPHGRRALAHAARARRRAPASVSLLFQTPASATRVPRTGCGCASAFQYPPDIPFPQSRRSLRPRPRAPRAPCARSCAHMSRGYWADHS